jgi:DNA-binding response OmpR family regulator
VNKIIVVDNMIYIVNRIKDLLSKYDIEVYGASNSTELINVLNKNKDEIDLILIDILLEKEDGFEIIKMIQKKKLIIPIMILSDVSKKSVIAKSIQIGAIDYILKPFNDEFIVERIVKNINNSDDKYMQSNEVKLDFQNYLIGEIKKAQKGKYSISIMMLTLSRIESDSENRVNSIDIKLADLIKNRISELFWETDVFIRYASRSSIGVFPFCTKENTKIVNEKILKNFNKIREKDERFKEYKLENVFSTYPDDGDNKDELFSKIISGVDENFEKSK